MVQLSHLLNIGLLQHAEVYILLLFCVLKDLLHILDGLTLLGDLNLVVVLAYILTLQPLLLLLQVKRLDPVLFVLAGVGELLRAIKVWHHDG